VQNGDPSIAHQRHVDAADRRRLLRHSKVEAEEQAAEEYGRLVGDWVSGGYRRVGAG
jgi:hypothetical protein